MGNPALWTAIAGCIGATAALITAVRARGRAADAHDLALGHSLDRTAHLARPKTWADRGPAPSSPAGPSSG